MSVLLKKLLSPLLVFLSSSMIKKIILTNAEIFKMIILPSEAKFLNYIALDC